MLCLESLDVVTGSKLHPVNQGNLFQSSQFHYSSPVKSDTCFLWPSELSNILALQRHWLGEL